MIGDRDPRHRRAADRRDRPRRPRQLGDRPDQARHALDRPRHPGPRAPRPGGRRSGSTPGPANTSAGRTDRAELDADSRPRRRRLERCSATRRRGDEQGGRARAPLACRRFRSQWPQGTSSGRTSTASTVIPTTRAKPSCRSELSGLNRNEAKLTAVIAAAEVIRPPVWRDRPDDPRRGGRASPTPRGAAPSGRRCSRPRPRPGARTGSTGTFQSSPSAPRSVTNTRCVAPRAKA